MFWAQKGKGDEVTNIYNLFVIQHTKINDHIVCATWSELGIVYIYDVTSHLNILDTPDRITEFDTANISLPPLFAFDGHQIEGYALAWSRHDPGMAAFCLILNSLDWLYIFIVSTFFYYDLFVAALHHQNCFGIFYVVIIALC